jgi:hypothetical protein
MKDKHSGLRKEKLPKEGQEKNVKPESLLNMLDMLQSQ